MDPCFAPDVAQNCKKTPCSSEYECCSHPDSKKGTCVRPGTCNRKTGFCKSDKKPASRFFQDEESFARYGQRENYKEDCQDWKQAMFVLSLISLLILVCFVCLYLKFSHRR